MVHNNTTKTNTLTAQTRKDVSQVLQFTVWDRSNWVVPGGQRLNNYPVCVFFGTHLLTQLVLLKLTRNLNAGGWSSELLHSWNLIFAHSCHAGSQDKASAPEIIQMNITRTPCVMLVS